MLHCSNFKDRYEVPSLLRSFYIGNGFHGSKGPAVRCGKMGYSANTSALRSLLTAASGLRQLADDRLVLRSDKRLYLTAAAALEARADHIASSLPGEDTVYDPRTDAILHRPVDLLV